MRTVLHSDLNNCFASIESISHPEYKKIPFAVGGDEEKRHGIILAKNEHAKKFGIKTGESLVEARKKCPDLKIVKPHFDIYDKYCTQIRELYGEYTDQVEPFGIDECWLDTTESESLFGSGVTIANELRKRIKKEFGLTVSVGVSYNKVFAKLGSDYRKPNAVTVITVDNYRDIVWEQPVESLLFIGRSTKAKLNRIGVKKIGELANTSEQFLISLFGKNGSMLYSYANGLDTSPVKRVSEVSAIKSIGNSTTTPRDMKNAEDVNIIFHLLAEQVSHRMRSQKVKCGTVQIYMRNSNLFCYERQVKLQEPTDISGIICSAAMKLLIENYDFSIPLRSVGIRASDLISADAPLQISLFSDAQKLEKLHRIDVLKDEINEKYGNYAICRGVLLSDKTLSNPYVL